MASPLKDWFLHLNEGVGTALKGMKVTFKHLFRHPTTVEYPEVNVESRLPERYRGILQVDLDICIGCHLCDTACPICCIHIDDLRGEKTLVTSKTTGKPSPKVRYPTRFDIDIAKCMFCGLCVEPCPTGAIHHTRRFEGTVSEVATLTYSYVRPEDIALAEEKSKALADKQAAKQGEGK